MGSLEGIDQRETRTLKYWYKGIAKTSLKADGDPETRKDRQIRDALKSLVRYSFFKAVTGLASPARIACPARKRVLPEPV